MQWQRFVFQSVQGDLHGREDGQGQGVQTTVIRLLADASLGTRVVYGLPQDLHVAVFWPRCICSPRSRTLRSAQRSLWQSSHPRVAASSQGLWQIKLKELKCFIYQSCSAVAQPFRGSSSTERSRDGRSSSVTRQGRQEQFLCWSSQQKSNCKEGRRGGLTAQQCL